MTIIEFVIVTGILWVFVILIGLIQFREQNIKARENFVARLFSSFLPMVLIHLALFCSFYSALGYLIIQMTPLFKFEILLSWSLGGILCIVSIIEVIRVRTDRHYLLEKWILKDLKDAENPKAHLESLIRTIQSDKETESSKRVLIVLRNLATRGDSIAGLIWTTLETYNLY